MLAIGSFNRLIIRRITAAGAFLATDEGDVLLPGKYLQADAGPGDSVDVFVYLDSKDRPIATTLVPKASVGEFACLEVVDVGGVGAFLDWGLEKDLFVPFSEQPQRMKKGERHVVRVYLDNTGRLAASARLGNFLQETDSSLGKGAVVDLMIYDFTDLGAKVIINNCTTGLLFRDELHGRHVRGEHLKGYVKKVRDDGKIDVTLRKDGIRELEDARKRILRVLAANGGFLPLGDKSPPEMIAEVLRMSKKTFKKAVGGLYKDGFVVLTAEGLKLRQK